MATDGTSELLRRLQRVSGDCLDAVLCAVQVGMACVLPTMIAGHENGMASDLDPLAGCIVTVSAFGYKPF